MEYIQKKYLKERGAIDQVEKSTVNGTLLVGEHPIYVWKSEGSAFGLDWCYLYQAKLNNANCFLFKKVWESADGYNCSGITSEAILSFEDGLKLLLHNGNNKSLNSL